MNEDNIVIPPVPDIVREAQETILAVKTLLIEKPRAVQGWVLADLTAIWLSNQPHDQHEKQLEQHITFVKLLLQTVYDNGEIDPFTEIAKHHEDD